MSIKKTASDARMGVQARWWIVTALTVGCGSSPGGDAPDTGTIDTGETAEPDATVDDADATGDVVSESGGLDSTVDSIANDSTPGDSTPLDSIVDASVDASTEAGLDTSGDSLVLPADTAVDAPSDGGSDAGPPLAASCTCATGYKACGSRCVSVNDPLYGCGEVACERCVVPDAVAACAGGRCAIGACVAGRADCDKDVRNGCESDLTSTVSCATCGTKCATGQVCTETGCAASCTPPATNCSGRCVNLTTSVGNCGACDSACTAGDTYNASVSCAAASCVKGCTGGKTLCLGKCVDTLNDPLNCGSGCMACTPPAGHTAMCVAGSCVYNCAPGLTTCSGKCVDLKHDDANCGACGTTCTGGCAKGVCATSALETIVGGLSDATDLAVDGTNVYFSEPSVGAVKRAPKGGGTVTTISSSEAQPVRIAIDDTYVYWANKLGGAIMRAPKTGGAPSVVATAVSPIGVAVDSTHVYFGDDKGLWRIAKSGGSSALLWSSGIRPMEIALGITKVFARRVDGAGVTVPKEGEMSTGPFTPSTAKIGPASYYNYAAFGAGDSRVYFGANSALGFSGLESYDEEIGSRLLLWSGTGTSDYGSLGNVVLDTEHAYWISERPSVIRRVRKCGGPVILLSAPTSPRRLASDGTYLYITNGATITRRAE